MSGEMELLCDHCAKEVTEDEVNDCAPDSVGYCILCGRFIGSPDIEGDHHDR